MADHLRRQIRDAAKTILTGLTTTGARVFVDRVYPLQSTDLPGLRIMTNYETIGSTSFGANRRIERQLELVVEACSKLVGEQGRTVDDQLDQIAKEVEVALANNNTLSNTCKYVQPEKFESDINGEADKPFGILRMTFSVFYMTALDTPDVPL